MWSPLTTKTLYRENNEKYYYPIFKNNRKFCCFHDPGNGEILKVRRIIHMFNLENIIEMLTNNKEVLAKYITMLDVSEYYAMCKELEKR